jgi:hypothetical protein
LRLPGATAGVIASAGWIAERAFGVSSQVPALVEVVAAHAVWLLAGLAGFAVLVRVPGWLRRGGDAKRARRRPLQSLQ